MAESNEGAVRVQHKALRAHLPRFISNSSPCVLLSGDSLLRREGRTFCGDRREQGRDQAVPFSGGFFGEEESLAVVDEVFAPEVVWLAPGNGEVIYSGTGEIKAELRRYRGVGGEIAILEQIAEGESVATRYRLEVGREQRRAFVGVTLSRFADDGKIHEYRVVVMDEPDDLIRIRGNGHN